MNAEDLDRLAAARADRGMTVPLDRLIQALLIGFLSGAETGPTRLARQPGDDEHDALLRAAREGQGTDATPLAAFADLLQERGMPGAHLVRAAAERREHVNLAHVGPYQRLAELPGMTIGWNDQSDPEGQPILQVTHRQTTDDGRSLRTPDAPKRLSYIVPIRSRRHLASLVSDLPKDAKRAVIQATFHRLPDEPGDRPFRMARSGVGPYDVYPPNPKAQAVAKAYHDDAAGRLGLPAYQPLGSQLKVNENASRRAALVFAALRHDPSDPMVQKSYAAFKKEIVAQYLNMLRHGVKVHRSAPGENNYLQMHNDLLKTGGMSYEPTAVTGFGTHAGFEDNPLHEQVPGMPKGVLYNDLFRVIHDYYGHAPHGHDFSPTGELRAWHEHARMFSPLARRAMTTETHGQNSWLHFGPHIEGHETSDQKPYADQKAALLPKTEWPLRFARPGEPVSHVYVSPSTREGSTFPQAYQGIDSPDMGALTAATPGGKSGYGVWHDGAEEVRHWPLTNPVVADAEASRIGKLFKQKAALVFHEGVGPDILHILRVPVTDPERIARELEEHGVQFKTILPEQGASEVHVVDFGGQMGKALADYAKRSGALSYTTRPGTAREIPTA